MYNLVKSILKGAVYVMDQADRTADEVRNRVDRVSDKVSDITDRGRNIIAGEDHTLRNAMLFAAGVGVGIGAGVLFAPAPGEEIRNSMREKVEDIGDRVRGSFSAATRTRSTGTEGGI